MVAKLGASPLPAGMRKVLVEELLRRIEELFRDLSDWLLAKSGDDIEKRYLETGERRASQGVALPDFCWTMAVTKAHLWGIPASTGLSGGAPLNLSRDETGAPSRPIF